MRRRIVSAAAHYAAQAVVGKVNVLQAYAGMDGEIVHSLLALLDDSVAIDLPCEVFHPSANLFQCLIDGHCAHWDGAVAQYPLAYLVDVVAR